MSKRVLPLEITRAVASVVGFAAAVAGGIASKNIYVRVTAAGVGALAILNGIHLVWSRRELDPRKQLPKELSKLLKTKTIVCVSGAPTYFQEQAPIRLGEMLDDLHLTFDIKSQKKSSHFVTVRIEPNEEWFVDYSTSAPEVFGPSSSQNPKGAVLENLPKLLSEDGLTVGSQTFHLARQ